MKLKIGLAVFGSLVFVGIVALCGTLAGNAQDVPSPALIAGVLCAAYTIGAVIGFTVRQKPVARIGGFVSPPRIAGRHGQRIFAGRLAFSFREHQLR
jgi:hypothetical protein